jgi:hypothetical protein
VFKGRRMEDDVDIFEQAGKLHPISHIGKKEACVLVFLVLLLREEQLGFTVIDAYEMADTEILQQLLNQLTSDGAATASNENRFVL